MTFTDNEALLAVGTWQETLLWVGIILVITGVVTAFVSVLTYILMLEEENVSKKSVRAVAIGGLLGVAMIAGSVMAFHERAGQNEMQREQFIAEAADVYGFTMSPDHASDLFVGANSDRLVEGAGALTYQTFGTTTLAFTDENGAPSPVKVTLAWSNDRWVLVEGDGTDTKPTVLTPQAAKDDQ